MGAGIKSLTDTQIAPETLGLTEPTGADGKAILLVMESQVMGGAHLVVVGDRIVAQQCWAVHDFAPQHWALVLDRHATVIVTSPVAVEAVAATLERFGKSAAALLKAAEDRRQGVIDAVLALGKSGE